MDDIDYILHQNDLLPDRPPIDKISAWVEGRRVLPPASPFPGPWRNERTPYSIEIMDNMSPYSPVQRQAIMKARKLGLTTAIENCVAYFIDQVPSEQLYSTANEQLAKDWSKKKISHVIDSLNIRNKLIAADQNTKSRATGDRMFTKEYIGGALDIITASSLMARRALDKRCLWIDETDGIEAQTSTGEGSWAEILMAHTNSYGARRKISLFGSPTTYEASLIRRYYEKGDQRKFLVPCPACGRDIELKLDNDITTYGLKAETEAGVIIDAYYECEYCHEPIFDNDKLRFYSPHPQCSKHPGKKVNPAHWEPTKKPDPIFRSYQINSLYSPVGMLSFREVAIERETAKREGSDAARSFVNIYAGLTYKDETSRPLLSKILEHRGTYERGTVPPGVLFITMACDVQRGYAKDPNNPPRIELEVMGTGLGYKTWSIEYKVFAETYSPDGNLKDPYGGAWEDLYQWMKGINGTFYSKEGIAFQIIMIGIDSGDAADGRAEVVYRFCERWSPLAFPVKGFSQLSARRGEKADIPGAAFYKKYRMAKIGTAGESVIEISTAYYKETLFGRLNIAATNDNTHPNGYCDFPRDYPDDYFIQLINSEKLISGGFRDIGAHEAMDCRIYNLCMSDAWLESQVRRARDDARKNGKDPTWVDMTINSRTVLENEQARLMAYKGKL